MHGQLSGDLFKSGHLLWILKEANGKLIESAERDSFARLTDEFTSVEVRNLIWELENEEDIFLHSVPTRGRGLGTMLKSVNNQRMYKCLGAEP